MQILNKSNFYPVILAGGRGTRFWPLSRKRRAKQLLALDGKQTMMQQTVSRLLPLALAKRFWVITNEDLRHEIQRQLPRIGTKQILAEPVGRNTAPAIGLAAFILLRTDPDAVIGMFPSDHVIGDEQRYREVLKKAVEIAAAGGNIVVLGIRPTRAETGYGYIEAGSAIGDQALRVRRFTEKPDAGRAAGFQAAGNYFWNSGMFLWSARTLANALHEHLVVKHPSPGSNVISAEGIFTLNAEGNYIHAPGKFVAAVAVNNLVVVETEDAVLITTRERAQDVGKVVKYLDEKKLHKLV